MTAERCELRADGLDEAGLGVGTAEGLPGAPRVHVVDLLPGEVAEVQIEHRSPHRAQSWGRVLRRLGPPSPDRVAPPCPAFGTCGGCAWQHLGVPAQLEAKRRRVVDALAGVASADAVASVRPSPAELGYRNKGKYVVGSQDGRLVLGAYAPRSHRVVDTAGCRVVAPVIDVVAGLVRDAAEAVGLVPYDEASRAGELRYVVVRDAGGRVLVTLVTAPGTSAAKLDDLARRLGHPALAGVVGIEHDRRDGVILPLGASTRVLAGQGTLTERLAGVDVEVGAGEFLQVNLDQARAMYARVAELAGAGPGRRAVDLFAGLGGIGLHLARAGADVVAVEIDADAVARLDAAARAAGLPLVALAGDAGGLPDAVRARLGAAPDVVVVNPPRKGLSPGAVDLLVALGALTVVYVSCGPASLGRDLVALAAHGWRPDVIEPFDLMPGTAQVETVVRLVREAP